MGRQRRAIKETAWKRPSSDRGGHLAMRARTDRRLRAPCYSGGVALVPPPPSLHATRLALAAALSVALTACGTAPLLPATTRARAVGFEAHEASTPRWSRWGRVGALRFLEVVIGTDEVERALPMVVALHGFGDAPRVPDGPYLGRARAYRLVMPEGPVVVEPGHAWSALRVRDERPEELAADLGARADEVISLVEILSLARPTRGRPVLTGFSQGGHLALTIATRRPQIASVVLPMAAWLPPSLQPTGAPPALTPIRGIHARDDERVPIAPTEALYARLHALGWDARLEIVDGTHAPTPTIEAFVARELDRALVALEP
jgi:phospholipase/carboxylesterase